MPLNSFSFVCSFFVFLILLTIVEGIKKFFCKSLLNRIQILLLLGFSCFFILKFDWRFLICTFLITTFCYLMGILIEKQSKKRNKKMYLTIGISVLLLILGYFKYTNFFLDSLTNVIGKSVSVFNILLPVGISFYVFSAIAYLIDIYRKEYPAVQNFIDFALYISFFPKFISGPIIKGREFFPQVRNYRGINSQAFTEGIQIFAFGMFEKTVLADHLNLFVNDVFYSPSAYNTGTVFLAIISYSLQIYFDFTGYSAMATGIAKIVGFDFCSNFNLPYIAKDFSDFWRRWHISLSSWFKDYLYIPLGGSKKGIFRTYLNLMLVMLISGLWHGAGWTFILWGLLHGLMSCLDHFVKSHKIHIPQWISVPLTFIMVSLFWVFFRADSISNGLDVLRAAFTIHSGISQPFTWTFFAIFCLIISTIFAYFHSKEQNTQDKAGHLYINGYYPVLDLSKVKNLTLFFVFCGLILIFGYFGNTVFIYGNF